MSIRKPGKETLNRQKFRVKYRAKAHLTFTCLNPKTLHVHNVHKCIFTLIGNLDQCLRFYMQPTIRPYLRSSSIYLKSRVSNNKYANLLELGAHQQSLQRSASTNPNSPWTPHLRHLPSLGFSSYKMFLAWQEAMQEYRSANYLRHLSATSAMLSPTLCSTMTTWPFSSLMTLPSCRVFDTMLVEPFDRVNIWESKEIWTCKGLEVQVEVG